MEECRFDINRLPRTIWMESPDGKAVLYYVDQRCLPDRLVIESTKGYGKVVDAVKSLAVRGAPAIGVAGVAALALWAQEHDDGRPADAGYFRLLQDAAAQIAHARPTAVNLDWAVSRALRAVEAGKPYESRSGVAHLLIALEKRMEVEDESTNRDIGKAGAALLPDRCAVLTHCNAGSLATCFYGTALGVVYAAAEAGKDVQVYADETRPVGQGARLTAWELSRAGIPVTLICDDMAASVMAQGLVDAVVVGADRIARNGDVANKIGTYGVAVLAHEHGIPFYVAAPMSTFDPATPTGADITIEQRDASEVLPQPIRGVEVLNPAFDVTPARLVTAVITENGVFRPTGLA